MENLVIRASSLCRWYGRIMGLNELTVDIGPGVTGLLGRNGAGKSTLLNLVTGQIRPSQGTIEVLGENPWGSARLKGRIGYCPEADAFYDFMTGREFVTRLARLSGMARADAAARARDVLVELDMGEAMDRAVGGYSKGMRQRTKLAQALVHDPELVILDEPLVGADPIGRRLMIDRIRKIGREGRHVLVSSHILHEVEAMTDQIILLDRGRLRASGHIAEIRSLIDDHPSTVRLRTADARKLAAALVSRDDVRRVEFGGPEILRLQVAAPQRFFQDLPGLLVDQGITPEEIEIEDEGLDAVFHYLVGGRSA